MIGLTCAIGEELRALGERLSNVVEKDAPGEYVLLEGSLGGVRVAVICHGTGKAASAAGVQFLIDRAGPSAIINFGTAGALVDRLSVGDVVVADRLFQGDVGVIYASGFVHTGASVVSGGEALCVREYRTDSSLLEAAIEAGHALRGNFAVEAGPVVSRDQVTLCRESREELNDAFGALAVEMEGAAVAHVATMNRCPFAVVRAVSDTLDFELEGLERLLRYAGESSTACWSRRARFVAANPAAAGGIGRLKAGIETASANAAAVACRAASDYAAADGSG